MGDEVGGASTAGRLREGGARVGELRDYVRAARELGFDTVSANDHLLWRRPWLDGLTALSAVVEHAAGMTMATSVALPAVATPSCSRSRWPPWPCCMPARSSPDRSGVGSRGLRGGGGAVPRAMDAVRRGGADPASGVAGRGSARCRPRRGLRAPSGSRSARVDGELGIPASSARHRRHRGRLVRLGVQHRSGAVHRVPCPVGRRAAAGGPRSCGIPGCDRDDVAVRDLQRKGGRGRRGRRARAGRSAAYRELSPSTCPWVPPITASRS